MSDRPAQAHPELSWLPEPPSTWGAGLAVDLAPEESWSHLKSLAGYRLGGLATVRLDRRLQRLFGDEPPPDLATKPVRLAVLASSTVDHLLPALRIAALRRGLWLIIYVCDYGQYRRELLDPGSALHAFRPSAILFALDAHHLAGSFRVGEGAAAEGRVERLIDDLASLWRAARSSFGCAVLQQTALPLFPMLMGNNEHRLAGSPAAAIGALNERLRTRADQDGVDIVALDSRAAQDGIRAWHDPMLWHRAKQEVHPLAAPLYGDMVSRLLAAQQGRSFKCLVLDLDNTLWGGVIGDDGLDGIVLGQGSALGEAYTAFQRYVLDLSKRGVILALCSKNDEANGLEPFDKHPEMLLRRSDIACFAINWSDKVANIRQIAERLNIGLDALVFADDNPFERNLVRRDLPMVAVPELPEDPALYAECIADAGYFENSQPTEEDLERTRQYQANAQRETLRGSTTDLESYLRSLDMEMRWGRFDTLGKSRIVQLINKTNQFNLTTRRCADEEVSALIADDRALTLQIRLTDQFGDNGVIAIVAGRERQPGDICIDTWLMSCRVLGRQVEEATLNLVAAEARRLGAVRLIGEYIPSAKNAMVRDHYAKLGFALLEESGEGVTRWVLPLDDFAPKPTFINSVGG
ncbi:HAD-IIIC family phosphatase [Rhizorhabdus argentea]|uniref:HAD-IIIC family phosphatase n=1 Tax=Rhizorhabdus argentea TaxID=1387174 RepID=UPI0030EB31CF